MRSARDTGTVLRSLSPLGLALLVVGVFLLFQHGFHVNTSALTQLAAAPAGGLLWQAKLHATRSHWATALFAATLIMLALAAASIAALWRAGISRLGGAVLSVLVSGLWTVFHARPDTLLPPFLRHEMRLVRGASAFDPEPLLVAFLSGMFSTALLAAVAVGYVLRPLVQRGANLEAVSRAQATVRSMLTLATLWLIVGVIGVGLFHRMASASVASDAAAALDALGAASTVFSGAFYSALLAAVFLPAESTIRSAARALAPAAPGAASAPGATEPSPVSTDKWLLERGFELTVPQQLLRVLAVLGPLLASVVQNLAELK